MTDVLGPKPYPGSPEACLHGCFCPRLDNGHGNAGLARDRGGWVIFTDCPLHGSQTAPEQTGDAA